MTFIFVTLTSDLDLFTDKGGDIRAMASVRGDLFFPGIMTISFVRDYLARNLC